MIPAGEVPNGPKASRTATLGHSLSLVTGVFRTWREGRGDEYSQGDWGFQKTQKWVEPGPPEQAEGGSGMWAHLGTRGEHEAPEGAQERGPAGWGAKRGRQRVQASPRDHLALRTLVRGTGLPAALPREKPPLDEVTR